MGKAPRKPDPRKQLESAYDRLYALYESGEISPEDTDRLYDLDAQLRPGWEAQAARDEAMSQPMMYDPEVGVPGLGILPVADPLYQKARRVAEDYLPYQISNNLFGRPASQDFLDREGLLGVTGVNLATRLGDAPRNSAMGNPSQAGADLAMGTLGLLGLAPGGRAAKEAVEGGVNAVRSVVANPPARVAEFLAGESGAMPVPLALQSDPAIAQAEEVLGLLRSGRESEITEQMLDMGDPVLNARLSEHLYRNYDLPMDEASRMARAREMGFSDTYHGTGDDISAVDPSFFGNGQDLLGSGFYTTTNTGRADRYVPRAKTPGIEVSKEYMEGGNVIPLSVREPNAFNLGDQLGSAAESIASSYAADPAFSVQRMSSGAIHVKDINGQSVLLDPMQPRHWALQNLRKAFGPTDTSNVLSEIGYSGVAGPETGGHTVRASYNPSDLRSRFARFDPRLAHLRNLNASLAAAGVPLGLLAMQPEEEQY